MKRILLLLALAVCMCAESWAAFTTSDEKDTRFYDGIWNSYQNKYLGAQITVGISRIGGWLHTSIDLSKYTFKRIERNNVTGETKETVLDLPIKSEDEAGAGTFKTITGSEWHSGLEYDVVRFRDEFEVEDVDDYKSTTTLSYSVTGKQGLTNKSITVTVNFGDVATGVESIDAAKQVSKVTYYNLSGVASAEPFEGVNVVVTRYSDGSKNVKKQLK